MELKEDYKYEVKVGDIVLAMRTELESEIIETLSGTSLVVERGKLSLNLTPAKPIQLSSEQVSCLHLLIFSIAFIPYVYQNVYLYFESFKYLLSLFKCSYFFKR